MSRELDRRRAEAALRATEESDYFDYMVEDIFVGKSNGTRSVRAAVASNGDVMLYSTDENALRRVYDRLCDGATVKGKKIKKPSREELAGWADQMYALPGPGPEPER